jgi:hypothetical protein
MTAEGIAVAEAVDQGAAHARHLVSKREVVFEGAEAIRMRDGYIYHADKKSSPEYNPGCRERSRFHQGGSGAHQAGSAIAFPVSRRSFRRIPAFYVLHDASAEVIEGEEESKTGLEYCNAVPSPMSG